MGLVMFERVCVSTLNTEISFRKLFPENGSDFVPPCCPLSACVNTPLSTSLCGDEPLMQRAVGAGLAAV